MELPHKVVVITGASAGVGRATTQLFAQHKASIGLLARGIDGLEGARREVEAQGGKALIQETDVADPVQVEAAGAAVEEALGPIDLWINCAMTSVFSPIKELAAEEVRRVTEVTYLGYVNGTLAALKRMLPRDQGVIIQVGSALAYRALPLQSSYCAAKYAIRGFTDSLRCELRHDGSQVRVTMVQMPALNTPQFGWVKSRLSRQAQPAPPIFQPEVAAQAILWAAKHQRRELKVGLSTVLAIAANKIAPGLLDRYLARTGYDSQQTDQPEDPNRPFNLWQPVPSDHGAHGHFDAKAQQSSTQLWVTTHRLGLTLAAGAVLIFLLVGFL